MKSFRVAAHAPSNIALIKYMGKKNSHMNIPENSSISLTLNSLCSVVEISVEEKNGYSVQWVPEIPSIDSMDFPYPISVPELKDSAISRVIRHFERVRSALPEVFTKFGIQMEGAEIIENRSYSLRTGNTFPPASGIASSASSFAAITLAVAAVFSKNRGHFEKIYSQSFELRRALASLSRQGSGSSCRSFEGPWVHWENENAQKINTSPQLPEFSHFVILVKTEPKKISSSDAHLKVRTSPLWHGRVERADARVHEMKASLERGDISTLAKLAWAEAWEMHSLFHTCEEPFSYWEAGTMAGLQFFAPLMKEKSPPIVTLDAGPNIHVIVEKGRQQEWRKKLHEQFGERILEDGQGNGAELISLGDS